MKKKASYHHGDLRSALLSAATTAVREHGIDALSLRKISEQVGVSRMGAYHHFKNKHELLCAVAAEGFKEFQLLIRDNMSIVENTRTTPHSRAHAQVLSTADTAKTIKKLVTAYLNFALKHPQQYELMFGRSIWQQAQPTPELKEIAHECFRQYVNGIETIIVAAKLKNKNALRIAQVSWATLHGLSHLFSDGIYIDQNELNSILKQTQLSIMAQLS